MTINLTERTDIWYCKAEREAARYFKELQSQVADKAFAPALTKDIQAWKRNHVRRDSFVSFFAGKKNGPDPADYRKYIGWLDRAGKLDDYLDRSISYIYLRDLGKDLASPETQARIGRVAADVKARLLRPAGANRKDGSEFFSLAALYRWAQKEGIEQAIIWVVGKLKSVADHIPEEMNAEETRRKLAKIILGVVLHVLDELEGAAEPAERSRRLDEAVRLGYFYGLTYPFIDDLLDSNVLDARQKEQYSRMIRATLVRGTVPELGDWTGNRAELIRYIHGELRDAYEYIRNYQRADTRDTFLEQSYVFFEAQEADRAKKLSNPSYTNEELYLPIIIKSASSRLIVRSVIGAPKDEGFESRTFHYGLYNQLADDFADMFEDMQNGAVTPYTYYLKYHRERPDLINPFELYWAVISHLIRHVYKSDAKTREVLLDRAVNGLKRYKKRAGPEKYNELMGILLGENPEFNRLIQHVVGKAEDVDFFDKLVRDQWLTVMKNERKEKEIFFDQLEKARQRINDLLRISRPELPSVQQLLFDTANYSLEGSGKRIRPILAWVMGVNEYGLQAAALAPIFRSLEFMHTASLIFDDLPSQDNSSTRRGRPTLHRVHDSAVAELTGLFLIQKAMEELASLQGFDNGAVLALIRYSSQKASEICTGQAMDLQSKGKALTLEQLNRICFYKTGLAFEVSLVSPAILAQASEAEIATLKKIAYHAGIAFQIKDDLLDGEGNARLLGKPVGKDEENNTSTFVTVLGAEGASKAMWEHYCLAMEALGELPRNIGFLRYLLDYMIHRDR